MFILGFKSYNYNNFMKNDIPEISKQINKKDTYRVLDKRYSKLGPMWVSHQIEWFNGIYSCFKDHDKFLIIIFLTKKTLDFYLINSIRLTFDEFFIKKTIEIEEFSISEISIALSIPKESARRKISELEKEGVIRRYKKKIIIDRSCFNYSKPVDTIKRISTFLSSLSSLCNDEKIFATKLTSRDLEIVIKDNFTHIWNFYYEMQIPMMTNYKFFFRDFETFHIFATCVVNQHFHAKRLSKLDVDRVNFIKNIFIKDKFPGINAMSISDITGIPRATVIRKLKKLIKKNILSVDQKKHYKLKETYVTILEPIQKSVFIKLANFSSQVYNIAIQYKKLGNKKYETSLAPFFLKSQ